MTSCRCCKGRGYVIIWQWVGYNSYVAVTCERCEGTGKKENTE
jgi:DnaJ-class molecular chaperone